MLRADRDELSWLRLNWGREYIVRRAGGVWTATPKWEPKRVLSEPTSEKLRAAMFEDAASRRMRSDAASAQISLSSSDLAGEGGTAVLDT